MKLVLINETTSYNEVEVLKESRDQKNPQKVKFNAILQTLDETNNNRRIYPKEALEDGLQRVQPRIKGRQFIGELDHPQSQNVERQATPLLSNASHLFTNVWLDGKKVMGQGETLNTDAGRNLANLLLDKVNVGFSLRGLGNVQETKINNETVNIVKPPLMIISWDAVSNPSHTEALVQEISLDENTIAQCVGNVCSESSKNIQSFILEVLVQQVLTEQALFNLESEIWWSI